MDLKEFHTHGQSIWLDYIRRDLLASGEFARMVHDDDVRGVTTNPSIFEKAIAESTDYDSALRHDVKTKDEAAAAIYERLVIEDIQQAADVLRPTHDATDGGDGFVSMEVSPYLAHDTRRGDLRVLGERGRRALRVHLGRDVGAGLAALAAAIERAVRPT